MYLYRVDKRYFEVGAEIQPQTIFEQYMDEESMRVEIYLTLIVQTRSLRGRIACSYSSSFPQH